MRGSLINLLCRNSVLFQYIFVIYKLQHSGRRIGAVHEHLHAGRQQVLHVLHGRLQVPRVAHLTPAALDSPGGSDLLRASQHQVYTHLQRVRQGTRPHYSSYSCISTTCTLRCFHSSTLLKPLSRTLAVDVYRCNTVL